MHLCVVPMTWALVSFDLLQSIGHYIYGHLTSRSILMSWQDPVIVCCILQNAWAAVAFWPVINPNLEGAACGSWLTTRWISVCYKLIFNRKRLSRPNRFYWHVIAPEHRLETSLVLCSCLLLFSYYIFVHILSALHTVETKQRNNDLWGTMTRRPRKTMRFPRGFSHASLNATQSLWPQPSLSSTAASTCPSRSTSTNPLTMLPSCRHSYTHTMEKHASH